MGNVYHTKEEMIDCVNAFYEGMVQRSEEMKRHPNYKTGENYAYLGLPPCFLIFDEYVAFFEMLGTKESVSLLTAFLETFFKLYPTATEKELAYYVSGNVIEPIGRDYLYSELVNPIFTKDGDNVEVKVAVKFLDIQTKSDAGITVRACVTKG